MTLKRPRSGLPARFAAAACGLMVMFAPTFAWSSDETAAMEARQAEKRAEFETIAQQVKLSKDRLDELKGEIAAVRKDNAAITAALIQSAKTEKKLAEDVEAIGDRLQVLKQQEQTIRRSLRARRGVLAEVLGALERMGLNPPPALLVKPEDALSSVRSAILLGAVVPEIRSETEILIVDLKEQTRLAASIQAERDRLATTIGRQVAEKRRLKLLLEEKQQFQARSEAELESEKGKSAKLAAQAKNLKDLIAGLELDISEARSAEEKARRAEEARRKREETLASLPVPEDNRLIANAPFSQMKGSLARPVAGRVARGYGDDDGNGGVMRGVMLATQSGAIVTAPASGRVLYAGPFRSYGQLLILNAGDGYHVVLAGMERISVSQGQSVLAGEPVGLMGEVRVASAMGIAKGNTGPELYIEFRKDGKPVDPTPWWSKRLSGRTANDS